MEAAAATTEDSREGVQKSLASWLVLRGHVSELSSDVAAHTALESFGLSDSPPQQEFADAPVFEPKPRSIASTANLCFVVESTLGQPLIHCFRRKGALNGIRGGSVEPLVF